MEVELTAEGVRLRMTAPVLFESGQADLLPAARPLLTRLAGLAAGTALLIRIEGHTDTVPIRTARYPSNWELSTARSVQVLRYLTEEAGFPVNRLSAAGRGAYHPLESNATEAGRQRNRRVEILFHVS
jgi:chemotaxis protein MotB